MLRTAKLVDGRIHWDKLGRIIQAFPKNAVRVGFRRLINEFAKEPLAMRAFLFHPFQTIFVVLREPSRTHRCEGTDERAGFLCLIPGITGSETSCCWQSRAAPGRAFDRCEHIF
ncbi:hypothetical protein [Mesorhizobium sp. B2-3-13]|uniref:hypothetical protein n=1 Tax=Mesorhizobium sp. B2-3-13 TaxID=2589951 RepID=UPI0015E3C7F2|nr:hypothetical protein [Mesorhizobium sp. B2-3-13]